MKERLENQEIKIVKLFWAICFRWRSMLLVGALFAVIFAGLSYIKSTKDRESAIYILQHPVTTRDLVLNSDLSTSARVYMELMKQYEAQSYYNDNSLLFNLDASGFYKGELSYYIDNLYSIEYPQIEGVNNIDALVASYWACLNSSVFFDEVINTLDISVDRGFVPEMVDVKNRYGATNTVGTNSSKGVFTVSFYGMDEDDCNKLLDIAEKTIEQQKSDLEKKFGKHNLIQMSKCSFFTADNTLLSLQRDQLDRLRDYNQRMVEAEKNLSDEDKGYIRAFKNELKEEYASLPVKPDISSVPDAKVNTKWIIAGFLFGLVLIMLFYAMLYIIGGRIKLEDDLGEIFGFSVLGTISTKKRKVNGIDGFLLRQLLRGRRVFDQNEATELSAANISVVAKKADAKKVYIIGASNNDDEKAIYKTLQEKLMKYGIEVESGRSILYDASSLERAAEIGNVIISGEIGESSIAEIADEIDMCLNQKNHILGLLMVE